MSTSGDRSGGHVVGSGIDIVGIERMATVMTRRPRFSMRVLTSRENDLFTTIKSDRARASSLAARFAAKEAVMKSLGAGIGDVGFRDIEITGGRGEAPHVTLHGRAATRAKDLGISEVIVSMTHDAGIAMASATSLGRCECNPS